MFILYNKNMQPKEENINTPKEENINTPKKVIEAIAPIAPVVTSQPIGLSTPVLSPSPSSTGKISWLLIWFTIVFILLIGAGAYYYFVMRKTNDSTVLSEQPVYPAQPVQTLEIVQPDAGIKN
jgi:hypothetical protein